MGASIRISEHHLKIPQWPAACSPLRAAVLADLNETLLPLPNTPLADVPDGLNEESNEVIHTSDGPTESHGNAHWDVAPALGILDLEAGAGISGSRFFVMKGKGAKLQRALAAWMLDVHTNEHGYTEIDPPLLVRPETMQGSGNLPKFRENLYHDDETDLWLVPTAEVALNALHQGKIIDPDMLPLKYVAQTPSFRKEHAAAGRDVRGIKRVHQFEKVEMVSVTHPDQSDDEQKRMLRCAEDMLERLGVPYRTVILCTGDMGFGARRTFDIEAWLPGQNAYREISSVSTTGDFQARRMNARFKPADGGKPQFVHTLNGSGLAVGRCLIAVLENGQQADGSVKLPDVLAPYLGGKTTLGVDGTLS